MRGAFESSGLITILVNSKGIFLPFFFKIEIGLDIGSMESGEVLVDVPFELGVAQVKNALRMRGVQIKTLVKSLVFDI